MTQAAFPGMEPTEYGGDAEFWETPGWAVDAVLPLLPRRVFDGGSVLIEPTAGRGAILNAALPIVRPREWLAYELDKGRAADLFRARTAWSIHGNVFCADFLTSVTAQLPGAVQPEVPWLFLGNPPFSIGTDVVEKCLRLDDAPVDRERKGMVAMLLQHDFATGVERCARVHEKWKSSLHPLRRRPKFGGQHSSGERPFSWFLWDLAEPKSEWRPIG